MMMTTQVRQFRQGNDGIKNPIYVTTQDKQRLEDLVMEVEASDPRKHGDLKALTEELHRAIIVDPKDVFNDVITMNSRAEMRDLESGESVAFTLVFPLKQTLTKKRFLCWHRSEQECSGIASVISSSGRSPTDYAE